MLHEFIATHRDEIITRCRAKLVAKSIPQSTGAGNDHGVAVFLEQLVKALRLGHQSNPEIANTALHRGHDLLAEGFTLSQVVHEYGDICQSITELAVEMDAPIHTDDFRMLNCCLDEAIAGAVTEYGRERDQSVRDEELARGSERLGYLAHELRNLVNTAIMAFEVLKSGNVGVAGSTGSVLNRSLLGLRALVGRSLAEIRLTEGIQNRERFLVAPFIEELAPQARMEAELRGITLTVGPIDSGVTIEGDRQVLGAVVTNLLQNAFKFTRPGTIVKLRVGAGAQRVLIEVEDECGGLVAGKTDDLFRPFEQRGTDRTGLGLGLAFSRWGADANHGRIYARSLADRGCVFTLDLPRMQGSSVVTVNH